MVRERLKLGTFGIKFEVLTTLATSLAAVSWLKLKNLLTSRATPSEYFQYFHAIAMYDVFIVFHCKQPRIGLT